MHHCKDVLGEVFFQTFKKTNESRQNSITSDFYTWSGCDTTSGTYGVGKIPSGYR